MAGRPMAIALAVAAGALVAMAAAPAARADDVASYRAVVDRADLEPAPIGGFRLRVFMSALTLLGQKLDVADPHALRLLIGKSEVKAPYTVGTYRGAVADTAIAIVIESNAAYTDALPAIVNALDGKLLQALSGHSTQTTQIAILTYGDAAGVGKLSSVKSARNKLLAVTGDGSTGDPSLLDTVDKALVVLKHAKPVAATTVDDAAADNDAGSDAATAERPLRKLMIIVSDGRDHDPDHARVDALAKRAAAAGVHIHTLAYSPTDARRPLLLLGELSKLSLGTLRWVRSAQASGWDTAVGELANEIADQDVVTFFVDDDAELVGQKLRLKIRGRTEATSNAVKLGPAQCANVPCEPGAYCALDHCVMPRASRHSGVIAIVLWIAGLVVAVLALLVAIGFALSKRAEAAARRAAIGGAAPTASAAPNPAPTSTSVAPRAAPAAPAPAPAAIAGPSLLVLTGPRNGVRIPLRHGFTIGKAANCDLVFDDGFTSGLHARFDMDRFGNCHLYDNQSTNGVFVNGVRVTESTLSHGVSLKIGSTELRFLAQ